MSSTGLLVVGIAGGTGSGKTTIASHLYDCLKEAGKPVAMITMDSYYRDLKDKPMEVRSQTNFDHPDSLEIDLLVRHVRQLRNGEPVDVPIYDFEKHQRTSRVTHIEPPDVLILEGILLYVDEKLRDLIDIKVFVDADPDVRFVRRLKRDVAERGRTVEQICKQYNETVRVMHDQFVEPSKKFADIVVPNLVHGDYDVIIELLAARAMTANGIESPRIKRLRQAS